MKLFNDKPTFYTEPVKDKAGKVKKDSSGHEVRRLSFSLSRGSLISLIPIAIFLYGIAAFAYQTQDTTKTVKKHEKKISHLQNKVITEQLANSQKMDHILTLLDPENGRAKIKKIEKDKAALLKELEEKEKDNGN